MEEDAARTEGQAGQARSRAKALAGRIQSIEAQIESADAKLAIIVHDQKAQQETLAIEQGPTAQLIAGLQLMARRPGILILAQPGRVDDLVHVRATLAEVIPAIAHRTAGLRAQLARSQELAREAMQARTTMDEGRRAVFAERTALGALAAQRRAESDQFAGSADAERDRAIAMGEEAQDIGALMQRIDQAAGLRANLESLPGPTMRPAIPGAARALPVDQASIDAAQRPYRLPVIGKIVTGLGEETINGVRARGLTIATQPDAQVIAPIGGRVAFAGPYRGYGNIVIIDHGLGWTTLLTSLASVDVRVGDTLDQGSPVGRAGTGRRRLPSNCAVAAHRSI